MGRQLKRTPTGLSNGNVSAADLNNQIRSALSLQLSHACIQYKTSRSEALVKLPPDANFGMAISNRGSVDEEIPSPEAYLSRRQALLNQYLEVPSENVPTTWGETVRDIDNALEQNNSLQASFQESLCIFFKTQMVSLALTKYRLLSRWSCFVADAEAVSKFGPGMRDRLASLTMKFHECNERWLRLQRTPTFFLSDALDYIAEATTRRSLHEHSDFFYIKVKWICREQQAEIGSEIDALLHAPEFREYELFHYSIPSVIVAARSNTSMFLHRDDEAVDTDLKFVLSELRLPSSIDSSNAHRLISDIRSHIESGLQQIAEQRFRVDDGSNGASESRPALKKATWIDDLTKCFIVTPSYEDVVESRLLRTVTSIDKVLLFESMSIEQQMDISTLETRAAEQANAAIAILNQEKSDASTSLITDVPVMQRVQALFMARVLLASKCEQKIVRRLNVLRTVQRRLVIDAVGGFAVEDPLHLLRHKRGSEISESDGEWFRPSDFRVNLEEFMKFEGIQHRDDLFERIEDDADGFRVKDSGDTEIIYDVALDDWKVLRKHLLMTATFFMMKIDAVEADKHCGVELDSNSAPSMTSTMCDRLSILLDLYRYELEFQSAKCRMVFALLEAYEHAVDKNALNVIAQRIVDVICARPRVDLSEAYFKSHYRLETRILLLESELVNDVTRFQLELQARESSLGHERFALLPYCCPVGLFDICTSTCTIADCLKSIRDSVAAYDDIWRRSHQQCLANPGYHAQAIQIAVLFAIRESWKQHALAYRTPLFSLSPFMESLRIDPAYADTGTISKNLEAIVEEEMSKEEEENRAVIQHKVFLAYFKVLVARNQLLKLQFESDLLCGIAAQQVRRISDSDAAPSLVGVKPGCTVAQTMGFPVELMHAACSREKFGESSSSGFLSIVCLQKIFCSALRFVVEYHGSLGQRNTALSTFDPVLFSSSMLITPNSLISLADVTSSVFERTRWKTSELARLARSKTEVYKDAISCQPDFLAGSLKGGLHNNGLLLDIITACERLAANVDSMLPLGQSPFHTLSSFNSQPRSPDSIQHWLFDLTRGVCLFRDQVVRATSPIETIHDDIEKDAKIYPILCQLCRSAISAQRLMVSSTANASSVFHIGHGSDFLMCVLDNLRANLFSTGTERLVALSRGHTQAVVQHCLQNLHSTLRLFSRNRADAIICSVVDPNIADAVNHLSLHFSINNKDAEEEAELQLKRIFYRLNQIAPQDSRMQFSREAETVVKLYDLIFALRKRNPSSTNPSSWIDAVRRVRPAESSAETRQTFGEIVKQGMYGSQALKQRRPQAFAVLPEEPPFRTKSMLDTQSNLSSDLLSTPIVFYLLSQDYGELIRLKNALQTAVQLEMESLDIIEIHLKAQTRPVPVQESTLPELTPIREFVNQLSACSTDVIQNPSPERSDSKLRKRDFLMIAKTDLRLHLTRLGRCIVLSKRKMVADFEQTHQSTHAALEQRLRIVEKQKSRVQRELEEHRSKAEWSINRGIIDSQFTLVLELERLKNRESRVEQRINAMETKIRDQVEREYQKEIASLKAQLLMKESRFIQYKSELRKQVSSSITEVRRQAMMGIVDSKRVPFQTKRQALQEIRDFTEESIVDQERSDMQRTMVRMKTLFEMKELTVQSRLEAQIRKAQDKADEGNRLFEQLEQSKQREKILLDQLIDEKNAVKLSRDALHQLKHELEGCQRDRRNLLDWKAKNERQMASLKSDVDKYADLKSIDIDALISRLRKSEEVVIRLAAERASKSSPSEIQSQLNKRIKQLEHGLASEQKAKGEAISEILHLRDRISELEQHVSESNGQLEVVTGDLDRERRLNSELVKESAGFQCLPFYTGEQDKRMDGVDGRHLRPQTSFVKRRAAVPPLQVAARHATFTARSRSSAKSRTASSH